MIGVRAGEKERGPTCNNLRTTYNSNVCLATLASFIQSLPFLLSTLARSFRGYPAKAQQKKRGSLLKARAHPATIKPHSKPRLHYTHPKKEGKSRRLLMRSWGL
ncbi:unnamed protein product, partial [Ectocarpus sp. 8 AP-2014]